MNSPTALWHHLGLLRTKSRCSKADAATRSADQKFSAPPASSLAENIVSSRARPIEGAPAAIRGITLSWSRKILPNADGSLGAA